MKNYYALRSATVRRASVLQPANPAIASRPVRKVVTKRTKRVVGYLSSVKMGGLVPWESQLEYDCLSVLEADNSVVAFHAQTEAMSYTYEDVVRRYYPDILVEHADGTTRMVEVKYQSDADDPENKALFEVFGDLYAKRDIDYDVRTEVTIRRQPRLANVQLMLEDRDHAPSERLKLRLAEAFSVRRPATLGDLEAALGLSRQCAPLYGMALRGYFDIDVESAPLSWDSLVFAAGSPLAQGGRQ
jgi:hypothetical protein